MVLMYVYIFDIHFEAKYGGCQDEFEFSKESFVELIASNVTFPSR
jgi:hypothetical protein